MILFTLSSTTSEPNKCMKVCLHCIQLTHAIRISYLWKISMPLLTHYSLSVSKQAKRSRTPSAETLGDFQWPPQEEEFVIALQEDGWNLGSVQSYNQEQGSISVQALSTLKTRAKDDQGKTYWIYPNDDVVDDFERNHILEIRPSVTLAKNVKRKDLVFALLNREIIEAMWGQLIGSNGSE